MGILGRVYLLMGRAPAGPVLPLMPSPVPAITDGDVDGAAAWACTGVSPAAWLWTGQGLHGSLPLLRPRPPCIDRHASKGAPRVGNIVVHGGCTLIAVNLQIKG